MSGPYNNYPQGNYPPPQPDYSGAAGYPPPAPQYGQPQSQYPQQQPSPYQSGDYASPPPAPSYGGSPQPGSYGPPSQGGFQHGQAAPYQDPNQTLQGHQQQYPQQPPQQQYPGAPPAQQYPQQGAYNQAPYPADPNAPQQGYGPTDPNAQAEGDRGLMGALAGGAAGYYGGNKMGGHKILGALAGAFAGSKLEDKAKKTHSQGKW